MQGLPGCSLEAVAAHCILAAVEQMVSYLPKPPVDQSQVQVAGVAAALVPVVGWNY